MNNKSISIFLQYIRMKNLKEAIILNLINPKIGGLIIEQ